MKKIIKLIDDWCSSNYKVSYYIYRTPFNSGTIAVEFRSFVPYSLLSELNEQFPLVNVFGIDCSCVGRPCGVVIYIDVNDEN